MREVGLGLRGDLEPAAYRELGAAAEAAGFDVLSVFGDLGFQPPLPALLLAALETRRIRLGPACLNPYTTHPVEIAGQVAALDHLSGGRAYLGLARGAWLDQAGVAAARPVAALREAHQVVRRLLAGDDHGFHGSVFRVEPGLRLRCPVLRPTVPILIGTWGERLTALAARIADELKIGGSASPAMVAAARDRLGPAPVAIVMGAVTGRGRGPPRPRSRCTWTWWRRSTPPARPTPSCWPASTTWSCAAITRAPAPRSRTRCCVASRWPARPPRSQTRRRRCSRRAPGGWSWASRWRWPASPAAWTWSVGGCCPGCDDPELCARPGGRRLQHRPS